MPNGYKLDAGLCHVPGRIKSLRCSYQDVLLLLDVAVGTGESGGSGSKMSSVNSKDHLLLVEVKSGKSFVLLGENKREMLRSLWF